MAALLLPFCVAIGLPVDVAGQRPNFPHDSRLIEKLAKGDYTHISDNNAGRMDLEAVLMAFARTKCPLQGGSSASSLSSLAKYVAYLNSDSVTGTYPSAEFKAMGLLGMMAKEPDAMWMFDPNAMQIVAEADGHCDSERVKAIGQNIFNTIDHHMAWREQKLGQRAPLMGHNVIAITRQAWQGAVEKDLELPAQPRALQQIAELQSRGVEYLSCEYGPTNPDSTGSVALSFWYKQVPIPGAELMMVSRKHPLAHLGDVAITACPDKLPDARQKLGESERLAESKVNASALPTAQVPLERVMGNFYLVYQNTKKSWIAYQSSHDPRDEQLAATGKAQLLVAYNRSCELAKKSPAAANNIYCQIVRLISDEFHDIPDNAAATKAELDNYRVPHLPSDGPTTPPAPSAPGQRVPPAVGQGARVGGLLPPGTQLVVRTLEAIDLLSEDEALRYRAQLARPVQNRGQVLMPQGGEVMLKMSRKGQRGNGSEMFVALEVESVVVDGKSISVTTRPVQQPVLTQRPQGGSLRELPPQSPLVFVVVAGN